MTMPKTYTISCEQAEEVANARKETRDKQVDKRLHAVQLRGEGKKNKEIAGQLETSSDVVSRWISTYAKGGLESLLPRKRESHHRNMSYDEETAFLTAFEERAQAGQVAGVSDIKRAYEEKVGHRIGKGQIYRVLKRHDWRKIKPRGRHPKKATPEAIEASKKLTPGSKN
jgi:transposase